MAILGVLICHYASLLPTDSVVAGVLMNGWAGVDLFFVISGFLITGILLDAKGSRHYFRNFYARRALRIFPLYYGFLASMLLVLGVVTFGKGAFLESCGADAKEGISALWAYQFSLWTYTANIRMAMQRPWHDSLNLIVPLWSLSVEEQFYLVWPVVVLVCSRRGLAWVCAGVMVGVAALRLALTARGVGYFAIYVLTPTRADALAAGAIATLGVRMWDERRLRRVSVYAAAMSGGLLILCWRGLDPVHHPWLRDGFYSALAVFFAVLLYWAIDGKSMHGIAAQIYEVRALRMVGRYSYGAYIFHLPVMYLTTAGLARRGIYDWEKPTWTGAMGVIAINLIVTSGLAVASFHFYEKPFLKLKRYVAPGNDAGPHHFAGKQEEAQA